MLNIIFDVKSYININIYQFFRKLNLTEQNFKIGYSLIFVFIGAINVHIK